MNTTTGTASGKATAAGLCKITATAPSNSTYSAASVTQSFAITPAPLTVTAINLTSVYGQSLPSLTPAINVNYSLAGFVNSDSASVVSGAPALSTTATASSSAGAYPITVSTGSLAAANYSFLYVNGTLTIQQAAATISVGNIPSSAVYGGSFTATYAYSGTGTPTESVASSTTTVCTVSGNTVKYVGTGTCTLQASAGATTNNAAVKGVLQSFSVSKATLTVTATNASRAFGAANPTFAVTYSGFVNSDTSAVLSGSPTVTTTATTTSLPGTYPITASQGTLAAANYTFTFVNGTLTVTATGSVPASSTTCNGAYTGTFKGNLTVSTGQNCVFVGGGASGNITETGGNLTLDGSTVGGSVTITGGTFSIGSSNTIKGSLQIESLPSGSATNQVCGAKISGSLQFESNKSAVLLGSGSACAGNVIGSSVQVISNSAAVTMDGNNVSGSLQVESNSGATTTDSNTVGGAVQIISNTGAVQVFTNVIKGALQCQSNSSITGSGNTAASKTGQCAAF